MEQERQAEQEQQTEQEEQTEILQFETQTEQEETTTEASDYYSQEEFDELAEEDIDWERVDPLVLPYLKKFKKEKNPVVVEPDKVPLSDKEAIEIEQEVTEYLKNQYAAEGKEFDLTLPANDRLIERETKRFMKLIEEKREKESIKTKINTLLNDKYGERLSKIKPIVKNLLMEVSVKEYRLFDEQSERGDMTGIMKYFDEADKILRGDIKDKKKQQPPVSVPARKPVAQTISEEERAFNLMFSKK